MRESKTIPFDRPIDLALFLFYINNCVSEKEWVNWKVARRDCFARVTKEGLKRLIGGHLVPAKYVEQQIYIRKPDGIKSSREMTHVRIMYNSQPVTRMETLQNASILD